jgi:RNA polymerase sigma factor (sigma-70 family)
MSGATRRHNLIASHLLSPSTASIDRREKRASYATVKSLREYLIVDQDRIRVELYRREGGRPRHRQPGQSQRYLAANREVLQETSPRRPAVVAIFCSGERGAKTCQRPKSSIVVKIKISLRTNRPGPLTLLPQTQASLAMPRADDTYIREILSLEPLLRAYLHRFAPKHNDLDDLLQETYARLLALPVESRMGVKSTQAFALTTARNIAVDWTRRRRSVPFDLVEDLDAIPVSQDVSSVEQIVNAHQELLNLARSVAKLPDRCAEVFTLRKLYGFTHQEIAKYFGISVSTVEQHLVKAVKRCKSHAQPPGNPDQRDRRPKLQRRWPWKGHLT